MASHPVLACAETIEAALKDVADVSPVFMTAAEKAEAMLRLTTLAGRVEALRLRVVAAADDVAEEQACRTVAGWLTARTRTGRSACARAERLAVAVDARWTRVGQALADGRVNPAQAEVIVAALDALPDALDAELVAAAEERLVVDAERFGPAALRRLGAKILEVVAPEIAEEHLGRALEADDQRASEATRLVFSRRGDGSTDIAARLPDAAAARLRTYLEAFTAPRQAHVDGSPANAAGGWTDPATGIRLSPERVAGHAFCALLERLDPARLPEHGGTATTVNLTLSLDQLLAGLGIGVTDDGDLITAGQVRRLACAAGIIPAVLGRKSEVLDLGRISRLFSAGQRKALAIGHPHCRAEGCTVPATWCEAHHAGLPWAQGGRTDLADGLLLCHWHHQRAHDTTYRTSRLPNGDLRYTRRT